MPKSSHCLRNRSEVIELKKLDNNLVGISTNLHGAKIFSYDECSVKSNITHENLNSLTSSVSFSPNGEFLAFSVKSSISILHIQSKIVIKTIKVDNETIDKIEFDPQSKYIIAATQSGRILQYRYDGSSMLARLYSFETNKKSVSSHVNSFAFHKNIMACAGDNGKILTIDLHSRANRFVIENNTNPINSLCIVEDSYVISGDSKGTLFFNSIKNHELIKKIQTGFTNIQKILLMPNKNYIMVIGDAKHVSIYNIKEFKLLHNKYIEFDDFVNDAMILNEHTILISLKNNSLEKLDLPNPSELESLVLHNSLDKAYDMAKKDSMLMDTKEYKELEKAYNGIYNQAVEALMNQNKEKALQLTSMFKYVDSKSDEIKLLFKAFENYPRLKSLYMEKRYPLAYALCAKFPPLTKTFQYAKMEEIFKDAFKNAQRQISHGIIENAKTLLNDYVTVAQKRPIIKLVLSDNKNFIKFLKAIEAKDFQKIDAMAKSNQLFTQIPTYKNVKDEMLKAVDDVQQDIDKCDIESASKKIAKLQNIDSISSKIAAQKNECRAIVKLQGAYKENNFIKCYETIDKHHFLNDTELGILLQKHWFTIVTKCEENALKGNIKDIKNSLGELIKLETRRDKIGDLFRLSFHTRIKGLMAKKAYKNAENIIYSYIDIFGLDNEIISIMKLYERVSKTKLAITQNQSARQSRDNWINSEIIMGS